MLKKILLVLTILTQITLTANAGVKISPLTLELDANTKRSNFLTTSFTAQAEKGETIRLKVYPEFFNITEYGKMDVINKTEAANCLIKYARFVPNEFTLQNGKPQKIRLTITNLKQLPDGESRMVLFLEDVVAKEIILPNNYKNITTKLIVKTRIGVPVYVEKGRIVKVASFDDLKVEENNKDLIYKIAMKSSGNAKIRCSGKGQIIKDGQLISEFDTGNLVLSSTSSFFNNDKLPLDNIKEPGTYTLRMVLNYKDQHDKLKKLIKEVNFTVNEVPTQKVENTTEQKETKAEKISK